MERLKVLKLSDTEAAYLAGFFDGEGTINYYNSSLRVSVAQKDPIVLEECKERYGGGIHTQPTGCSVWWVNGAGAFAFISDVVPYLRIKNEQVSIALAKAVESKTLVRIDDLDTLNERKARYIEACKEALQLQEEGLSTYAIGKIIVPKYQVKGKDQVENWLKGRRPRGWKEAQAC